MTWIDYWNSDVSISVSDFRRREHYAPVADNIA